MKRSAHRAATSACMPAATELFSDVRHVQLAFAPQAHPKSSVRQLPQENRNLHVADRERIVDQTLAIFFLCPHSLHLLLRDPYPGERAFPLQRRKRGAKQPQFRRGVSEINVPGAERRISSRQHQLPRQLKSVLVSSFEHEGACIGEYGGIKAGRNLGRKFHPSRARKAINQFPRGNGFRIDPVQISKIASAFVMVNIDQEILFQTLQARALHVIAFEQNGGVVTAVHTLGLNHSLSERQLLIYARNAVAKDNLREFAHATQNFAARERGSNRVTIRTRVRREYKPLALLNLLENFVDHAQCKGSRPRPRKPNHLSFRAKSRKSTFSLSHTRVLCITSSSCVSTAHPLASETYPNGPTEKTTPARAVDATGRQPHAG